MGPLDLFDHLANFVAPALFLAIALCFAARLLVRRYPSAPALWKQVLMNFAAGLAVLLAGLWFFGHDGKMATYAALVVTCATVQWTVLRGWRK